MTSIRTNLQEVQKATFGTQAGDAPDVYADYDRLVELAGKMADAVQEVEDLARLLDELSAPTHDGPDQGDGGPLVALSLAGRVAALLARETNRGVKS